MKASLDAGGRALPEWSEGSGQNGAFCTWPGVWCDGGAVAGVSVYQRPNMGAPAGQLPGADVLRGLPRLSHLRVEGWGVRGRLRPDYGGLAGLRELVLTVDGTGSGVPPEWGGMKSLQRLVVKCAPGGGRGAREGGHTLPGQGAARAGIWAAAAAGQRLLTPVRPPPTHPRGCNLTGTLPPSLGQLSQLRELNVTVNALTGQLPQQWSALANLKVLDVRWGAGRARGAAARAGVARAVCSQHPRPSAHPTRPPAQLRVPQPPPPPHAPPPPPLAASTA